MSSIFFATVAELGKLLRRKKVSSLELTQLFLDRLESIGPRYNALAELTRDLALQQARRADRRIRSGDATSPLLGIPFGAKDLLATRGIPTRWGAPPYRNQIFDYDATVIRRLEQAGAVLVGKLAMVELAGGGGYAYPSASLHGPGLNPWDPARWSGGSSSGSGSAVAAGLVPFALGSETSGSIIGPATLCGITGLRPTWGLVSRYGAMELAWSMDKVGPLAHSAEDCGLVLQAIAGYDVQDWTTAPFEFRFEPKLASRKLKLGVLPVDFSGARDIARSFQDALDALRSLGMQSGRAKLPDYNYGELTALLLGAEAGAAHEKLIKSRRLEQLVDAHQKKGLRKNAQTTAAAYVRGQQERARLTRDVLALFDEFDVLVTPSRLFEAPPVKASLLKRPNKRGGGGYVQLGALCGVPQLTLPMGFGREGLPVGLSLIGDLFDENTLLQIGMAYQHATAWHRIQPPGAAAA